MASIIDSFREVFTDRLSFLKLIVLAIPVYYSYQMYLQSRQDFTGFYWLAGITLFFLFGVLIEVTYNQINENNAVLPSLNPLILAFSAIKGILAMLPSVLISCLLANYICSLVPTIPWVDNILKTIIWLIAAAVIVTSFLMFCTNKKIPDVYNFKFLVQKAGDLIFIIIFFVIRFVILNIFTSVFVGYILLVLFGIGPIFDFFVSFALVSNIAITGHYIGQVHYENVKF